jgi:hypothetical protein
MTKHSKEVTQVIKAANKLVSKDITITLGKKNGHMPVYVSHSKTDAVVYLCFGSKPRPYVAHDIRRAGVFLEEAVAAPSVLNDAVARGVILA